MSFVASPIYYLSPGTATGPGPAGVVHGAPWRHIPIMHPRRWALAAMTVAGLACGGDAHAPVTTVATYDLRTVEGTELPYLWLGGDLPIYWVKGFISLKSDKRFEWVNLWRTEDSNGVAIDSIEGVITGNYVLEGASLTTTNDNSPHVLPGELRGDTLLYHCGLGVAACVFIRRPAPAPK